MQITTYLIYLVRAATYVGAAESITVATFYKNIATNVRIAIIAVAYYNNVMYKAKS